jgi:hypothetical protein
MTLDLAIRNAAMPISVRWWPVGARRRGMPSARMPLPYFEIRWPWPSQNPTKATDYMYRTADIAEAHAIIAQARKECETLLEAQDARE